MMMKKVLRLAAILTHMRGCHNGSGLAFKRSRCEYLAYIPCSLICFLCLKIS